MNASPFRLGAIDLNLLVVFDAIMQERSVTRAGRRLGLSQSAVSHALTRLRHMLKDNLFVRDPAGMTPTPRAEQLAGPIKAALQELRTSLEPDRFDPAQSTRTFRIAVDNYAAVVLVGPLAARLHAEAPGAVIDFRPTGALNLPRLMDNGEIDLALGPFSIPGERFSRESLFDDEVVVLLRKNHPALVDGRLSLAAFVAAPHLALTSVSLDSTFIDRALERRRLRRQFRMFAPFLSAEPLLAKSDMITVGRRHAVQHALRGGRLTWCPLPLPAPAVSTAMIWPRRLDSQAAHAWLRRTVAEVARTVAAQDVNAAAA